MHLSKLPSGHWRVAVKHLGERRTGTAPTRSEAQRLGAEFLIEMGGGGRRQEAQVTVGDLLAASIAEGLRRWSPTFAAEAVRVADAIPDTFTARRVRDVTPAILTGLWRSLERDKWGAHRIKRAHTILSRAWTDAIRLGWAKDNPCRMAAPTPPPPRQVRAPDVATVTSIIQAGDSPVERLALRISATTGARRGEVVALRWEDIDLDGKTLVVRRSLVWTKASGLVERGTKTGADGHRVNPLDSTTVSMLKKHRAAQREKALTASVETVWVFSDDAGVSPWRPDRLTYVYIRARKAAGVGGYRLHDLRHHVATQMLQDGEAVIDVAAQLGHRSMQTTQSTYAHFMPGRNRDSVDKRAARLDGAG